MFRKMIKKQTYYSSKPNGFYKYVVVGILVIFFMCVSAFALFEVKNFYSDKSTVFRILMNCFKSSQETNTNIGLLPSKLVLISMAETSSQEQLNSERQARAVSGQQNFTSQKSNSYYEEQNPVVVYSKTDTNSPIALKQIAEVPPKQDIDDEDLYSGTLPENDYDGNENTDYFGQLLTQQQQQQEPYYLQHSQPDQQAYNRQFQPSASYYRSTPYPQYFDDWREDYPGPDTDQSNSEEARASQYRDYNNNYYRQWHYATPSSPVPLARGGVSSANRRLIPNRRGQYNNKMQVAVQQKNRDPYPTYMDDYDYMPSQQHAYPPYPPAQSSIAQQQQMPQYRAPLASVEAEEKHETGLQMDILTIIRSLKTMWDLYQSFITSWNTIAERHNREEELAKEKYKQIQKMRINSRKPPKFGTRKNQTVTTKNPRKRTTTTTTTTLEPDSSEMYTSSEEEVAGVKKQPLDKVEPRKTTKGNKLNRKSADGLRDKRQAATDSAKDVDEGRYIKGDPLKGYYDFVITEGSYKFWAAFQVGTALLIIYSTFAAIYYSKVNPLVSDYDYTDYLGGARSLSGGDLDFVDDDNADEEIQKVQSKSWFDWLPRTGHSLKFILDAIDKLPTDHAVDYNKSLESSVNEPLNVDEDDKDYTSDFNEENKAEKDENSDNADDITNTNYTVSSDEVSDNDMENVSDYNEHNSDILTFKDSSEYSDHHNKAM